MLRRREVEQYETTTLLFFDKSILFFFKTLIEICELALLPLDLLLSLLAKILSKV